MEKKKRGNPNWVKGISGNPIGRPKKSKQQKFKVLNSPGIKETILWNWIIKCRNKYTTDPISLKFRSDNFDAIEDLIEFQNNVNQLTEHLIEKNSYIFDNLEMV